MRSVFRVITGGEPHARDGSRAEDARLVRAAARGDRAAVTGLTRRGLPVAFAVARRLLNDVADAEDVAQETFEKVWRNLKRFDPQRGRWESWVGRIAANASYDRLRKRGETQLDDTAPERADTAARADALLAAGDSLARVRAAITALPPRQRAALELCALRDHTNIEAAEILGVSVDALESLLSRARRTLKAALAEEREDLLSGFIAGHGGEM